MIDTLIGFGIGFYFGCFVGYLAGLLIMAGRDDHEQP